MVGWFFGGAIVLGLVGGHFVAGRSPVSLNAELTPGVAPRGPGQVSPTFVATGAFRVVGKDIIDSSGRKFIPLGGNVGAQVNKSFCSYAFTGGGCAQGHSSDAAAWGWNIVRLDVVPGDDTIAGVQQVIDEYTAKKIVVMPALDWSFTGRNLTYASGAYTKVIGMWKLLLTANKNNPYVWVNYTNEPFGATSSQSDWAETGTQLYDQVRVISPDALFVWDLPVSGQAMDEAVDGPGQDFLRGKTNTVLSWHNYTDFDVPSMDRLASTANRLGIPVVIGEFGYPFDGTKGSPGLDPTLMKRAADWVLDPHNFEQYGFGAIWWNATGSNDSLTLRKAPNSAWFDATLPMTEAGSRLFALGHR